MKVAILSKKLIKPSVPTPNHLHNFNLGFTDEMAPASNVPLILYYPLSKFNKETPNNLKKSKLESSLAQILTQFYPLAGRYVKESRFIECNDQGVEFIEARIDCPLAKILGPEMMPEELNQFLPRTLGEADEFTDPLVSIQVTMFKCGGVAIGISIAHRMADASTVSTFVCAWANKNLGSECINPSFNSSLLFPGRNIPKMEMGISRNDDSFSGMKFLTRVFVFDKKAIACIKSEVENTSNAKTSKQIAVTRVRSVCGVITKSLLGVDRAKHGRSRPAHILHTVDFRNKTCPPLPPHSCGNLCIFSKANCSAQKISQALDLKETLDLFEHDLSQAIADCKKILNSGEDGHMIVINSFKELTEALYSNDGEMNVIFFNSWCRLPYYEADFGWGKPAWVSAVSVPFHNCFLMDTKEGDGIEAWVSLDEEGMSLFRNDVDILRFAKEK